MNLRLNGAPLPSPRLSDPRRAGLLPLLGALLLAAPGSAQAGSEYISLTEAVPPNILFVVDMSASMNDPCPDGSGSGATSIFSTNPCYEDVFDAIEKVAQHFDWAHYGVVGTSDDLTVSDGYFPIVPLGTPYAELSAKLSATLPHATTTSNIAEAVADVAENYLSNSTASDGVDSDGDGFDLDWAEAPIEFSCQKISVR